MKRLRLVFGIILAILLVGSLSAQPMDQSTALVHSDEQETEKILPAHLLYDNLCSSPIDMTGSPTETRYITAGTCVEIRPTYSCECVYPPCSCSVTSAAIPGGATFWNCEDGSQLPYADPPVFCFIVENSGEYTFIIDVCPGETGTIECSTCCGR